MLGRGAEAPLSALSSGQAGIGCPDLAAFVRGLHGAIDVTSEFSLIWLEAPDACQYVQSHLLFRE
jgi:hypothetical protein